MEEIIITKQEKLTDKDVCEDGEYFLVTGFDDEVEIAYFYEDKITQRFVIPNSLVKHISSSLLNVLRT